jgi:hypothetical protein
MRHLAKQHGDEPLPAGEHLGAELGLILLGRLVKLPAWKSCK